LNTNNDISRLNSTVMPFTYSWCEANIQWF